MKLENLEEIKQGQKIKNYKELCTLFNMPVKSGNAKIAQMKEIAQYINLEKQGNGFIVAEIYDKPIEKIDNRGKSKGSRNNNNKFGEFIDPLLENFLYKRMKDDDYVIYITNNCIGEIIHMVNYNYRTCANNREKFHKFLYTKYNYSPWVAENDVFSCIYSKMRPSITSSLDRLQEQKKIKYIATYILYLDGEDNKAATDDENKDIRQMEDDTLMEMTIEKGLGEADAITRKTLIYDVELKNEFYKKVKSKVIDYYVELDKEIDGYFQGYKIVINNTIQEQKDVNIKAKAKEFNEFFQNDVKEAINKSNERIKSKDKYKHMIGEVKYDRYDKERLSSVKYKALVGHCINWIISYDVEKITDRIQDMKTKKQLDAENQALYNELKVLFEE